MWTTSVQLFSFFFFLRLILNFQQINTKEVQIQSRNLGQLEFGVLCLLVLVVSLAFAMLYLFLVDTGSMLTLDVDLALQPVSELRKAVKKRTGIDTQCQVLLISGGESLDADKRVCEYAAGTDTNPIFLFSITSIESTHPPSPSPSDLAEPAAAGPVGGLDLFARAEASLGLQDSQAAVATRAAIAKDFVEASNGQIEFCESLIHDQHLQHQGWLAVVANLEDTAADLRRRGISVGQRYRDYLARREEYRQMVETFDEDKAVLHRIPVFPALLEAQASDTSMVGSVVPASPFPSADGAFGDTKQPSTLLEWISWRGSNRDLNKIADSCYRTIETLDEDLLLDLESTVTDAVANAQDANMKEIKKVGERLQTLEQLHRRAQKLAREQSDLSNALAQNQARASGLKDKSILPDLCASHREQMKVMSQNYRDVTSIRRRCNSAKSELCEVLHSRMKWVVSVQDYMAESGRKLVVYSEELRRFERELDVIQQLHAAPSMYVATAMEVVRRRSFSEHYLKNAATLNERFTISYKDEVAARRNFQSQFKKHFLSKMFPGMDDMPPAFASEPPRVFDDRLPAITLPDVENLRREFPNLAESLQLPEVNALTTLFAKSISQALTKEDGETLYSLKNMTRNIPFTGTVSTIGRVLGGGERRRRRGRNGGLRTAATTDSSDSDYEGDEGGGGRGGRRGNGRRRAAASHKLTRSLPLEDSCLKLEAVEAATEPSSKAEASASVVDKSVERSSSSGGPTTSMSAADGVSSMAPSSSSAGSLMKQTDDGSGVLAQLNGKPDAAALLARLKEAELTLANLRTNVGSGLVLSQTSLADLRESLRELRLQVEGDRENFEEESKRMAEALSEAAAAKEAEEARHKDQVLAQLEDCHREIDVYRQHLHERESQLDQLRAEHAEDMEKWATELEERCSTVKKEAETRLALDHELELDALKEEMRKNEATLMLKEKLQMAEKELAEERKCKKAAEEKMRALESTQEEKINAEKDKIVAILEAGFSERERLAASKAAEEAEAARQDAVRAAVLAAEERAMEKSRSLAATLSEEMGVTMDGSSLESLKETYQACASQLQLLMAAEKESAVRAKEKEMEAKAKRDMDALRARFKMMQQAGAIAGSPSSVDMDLSLGVSEPLG